MENIPRKSLEKILEEHKKWIKDSTTGKRANLRNVALCDANLRGVDLSNANLRNVDLSNADLRGANLYYVNLCSADLSNADLRGANLYYANLSNANLRNVALCGANLIAADLSNADLRGADLSNANLRYVDLSNTNLRYAITGYTQGISVIAAQVDTSRENNLITYYKNLEIVTTGCFQGTLEELKGKVKETHADNEFLKKRYERAIAFIESEIEFESEDK